jgi:hypothetical protein
MPEQVPLGIVDASVPSGSHMCAFFSGSAQRDDVVAPFLAEGIRSGHKLYDLERFGAEVLMDTLRTHPRVIVDGTIHDNPYYVEPGKFVAARG